MSKKMNYLESVVVVVWAMFFAIGNAYAALPIWNGNTDFVGGLDQSTNPNLPWTYREVDGTLLVWNESGLWGCGAGYSKVGLTDAPIVFVSGGFGMESPATEIGGHSDYMIRWTSPIDGQIQISGYVYVGLGAPTNRILAWNFEKNGLNFTGGLTANDGAGTGLLGAANAVDFASGSGGATALILDVSIGDEISYIVDASPSLPAAAFGVLQIEQIPEPATMVLFSIGAASLLRMHRKV